MRRLPADRLLPALGLALLLPALGVAPAAFGKSSDRSQPMDLKSDHGDCNFGDADGPCSVWGNVVIVQGTLTIGAAKAEVVRKGGEIVRVILSGSPATFAQTLDDGTAVNGRANNVDYDMKGEQAVFTGNVRMTQPRGSLESQRVVYNTRTGQYTGGGDGSRVHLVIQPKSNPAPANPAPAKPPASGGTP